MLCPGVKSENNCHSDQSEHLQCVISWENQGRPVVTALFLPFICSLLAGICSATTPFVLLGDVLDCLPLDQCDKIFSFVEENVSTWKSVSNKSQPLSEGRCSISPVSYAPVTHYFCTLPFARVRFTLPGRTTCWGCAMVIIVLHSSSWTRL